MGASVPFVSSLGEMLPKATYVLVGACTPTTAEHAPDENLSLSYVRKLISALALILQEQSK